MYLLRRVDIFLYPIRIGFWMNIKMYRRNSVDEKKFLIFAYIEPEKNDLSRNRKIFNLIIRDLLSKNRN